MTDFALRQVVRDAKSFDAAENRAEEWRRLLRESIIKAQANGASLRDIAKAIGRSHQWVDRLVKAGQ